MIIATHNYIKNDHLVWKVKLILNEQKTQYYLALNQNLNASFKWVSSETWPCLNYSYLFFLISCSSDTAINRGKIVNLWTAESAYCNHINRLIVITLIGLLWSPFDIVPFSQLRPKFFILPYHNLLVKMSYKVVCFCFDFNLTSQYYKFLNLLSERREMGDPIKPSESGWVSNPGPLAAEPGVLAMRHSSSTMLLWTLSKYFIAVHPLVVGKVEKQQFSIKEKKIKILKFCSGK